MAGSVRRRYTLSAVTAAAVVALVAGILTAVGSHDTTTHRSAAQLLAAIATADIDGLSGTVVQNADLGLPDLAALGVDMSDVTGGSNQIRLWYAAPDKLRVAVLDDLGETDVIRNGGDLWTWSSGSDRAQHYPLPARFAHAVRWPAEPGPAGTDPVTVGRSILAALASDTEVSTDGTEMVADRQASRLVLRPTDPDSLIGRVVLSIDIETGVPLRVQVVPSSGGEVLFDAAFSRVQYGVPDPQNFRFTPPADVTVVDRPGDRDTVPVTVAGDGWSRVLVSDPVAEQWSDQDDRPGPEDLATMGAALPRVSGEWGSGRLLSSSLLTVLFTDDGRILMGAVTPQCLFRVAAEQ